MSRSRGKIVGGYVRKTVSLPATLVEKINRNLKPGGTISAFLTDVATAALANEPKKGS